MKAVGNWVLIEVEQQEEDGILVEEGNRGKIVSYGADCCFVKDIAEGIMTALPTAASQVTAGTGPGVNPFAQAAGAGLQAYAAYNIFGGTGIGGKAGPS